MKTNVFIVLYACGPRGNCYYCFLPKPHLQVLMRLSLANLSLSVNRLSLSVSSSHLCQLHLNLNSANVEYREFQYEVLSQTTTYSIYCVWGTSVGQKELIQLLPPIFPESLGDSHSFQQTAILSLHLSISLWP